MEFNEGQGHIKAWVGYDEPLNERRTVTLTVFDNTGTQVGQDSIVFEPNQNPQPIRTSLEVNLQEPIIRHAIIGFAPHESTGQYNLAIDDIEFDTMGPQPCPPNTPNPSLNIINPPAGPNPVNTQFNNFLLEGTVFSQADLLRATVTITSPTGSTNSQDLLSLFPGLSRPGITHYFGINLGSFLFPGSNTITVRVENCGGAIEIPPRTVIYSPVVSGTQFLFMGMEVTQAIQDTENSIPLITDKRTFVRAYLDVGGPTSQIRDVSGVLSAFRSPGANAGGDFVGSVRSLNTIPILSSSDIVTKRSTYPDGSLNFEIPTEWTRLGPLHFTLTPYVEGIAQGSIVSDIPCQDLRLEPPLRFLGCDNLRAGTSNPTPVFNFFQPAQPLRIALFPLPYNISSLTILPTLSDLNMLISWLQRAYPTPQVLTNIGPMTGTGYNGVPTCSQVNADLFSRWILDTSPFFGGNTDARTRYYGIVSDNNGNNFMRGCAPVGGPIGSGPTGPGTWGWDSDGSYGDWYGGHEMGHILGRQHPGYADTGDGACTRNDMLQDRADPNYPYANGLISGSDQRYFGFDVGDPANGISTQVRIPTTWTDVMTYRCNQWISDYTYLSILGGLPSAGPSMGINITGNGGINNTETMFNASLLVLGNLNLNESTIELEPFSVVPNLTLTQRPLNSSYTIDLLTDNGTLLARYPFEPKIYADIPPEEDQIALIGEVVPYVQSTARIVISNESRELASRTVSSSTPEVNMIYPNGGEKLQDEGTIIVSWNASDNDDEDRLTYSLLYSPDAGKSWNTIDVGINRSDYVVNLETLPGSENAKFRVIATDGVNTGIDDSDNIFQVLQKSPTARIISPSNNSNYSNIQTVVFNGEALDTEDGHLNGSALEWTSNKQGLLGYGRSISYSGLLPGIHTITLTPKDKEGVVGNPSTIQISVTAVPPIADAGANQNDTVGGIVQLNGNKSSGMGQLIYRWEIIAKPADSKAILSDINSVQPTFVSDLPGEYIIQLFVRDSSGLGAVDRVTVNVNSSNGIPNPQITSPRNGAQFFTGQTITFEGVAEDREDGELTGSSLQWHSSRDGPLGTGNRISVVLSGPSTPCMPEFIGHGITLTATDSDGNSAAAQIKVSVGTIC